MKVGVPEAFQGLYVPSTYKAFYGGRGGAKSHSCATALVFKGIQRPLRWLCVREMAKSLEGSVKQLLEDKIEYYGLQKYYTSTHRDIRGINGTRFLFMGMRMNPDSVRSQEGLDGVWFEEAHRCTQRSLDLLIPTLRKETSEAWFTWNRHKVTDPVDNMFLGGRPPPNSIVRKVGWQDNPWFTRKMYADMMWQKERDRDRWLHIWEGHPIRREDALVFKGWREEDLDEQVPTGLRPLFGADWGLRDPAVLVKAYRWGRTLYIAREVWQRETPIDMLPALFAGDDPARVKRWENPFGYKGIEGALRHHIIGDSASPDIVQYMKRRGFTIRNSRKGTNSVEEGVDFMQSHDIVVHPDCKHVVDELNTYSYKIDKETEEVLPELEDRDNHVIDACRYALETERRRARGQSGGYAEVIRV